MTSIATAVFKATLSLLLNNSRDKAATKLKEGDVTDQKFRGLIVREIDDIKSKLDGLARKDLVASISFFKEGTEILYEILKNETSEESCIATAPGTTVVKEGNLKVSLPSSTTAKKTSSLAKGLNNLLLGGLDELQTESLHADAKRRFKEARRKATEAFGNEALNTSDRILAMMVRVMGTILEKVDNPVNTLVPCRTCLEELHALPVVQKSFKIELTGGFKAKFNKHERKEIIAAVCHMNHVIYDVTQIVGRAGNKGLLIWPCVDIGSEKVDPLRDARVKRVLTQGSLDMGNYAVPWSFGQEEEKEHRLKFVRGIGTNSKEQFIIGDRNDSNVKIFNNNGKFLHSLDCPSDCNILDVVTDQEDNVYVLAAVPKKTFNRSVVCVFDKDNANLHRRFLLRDGFKGYALTIEENNNILLVLGYHRYNDTESTHYVVEVYNLNGTFVSNFELGTRLSVLDITASNDGHVLVLTADCVLVCSVQGVLLHKWMRVAKESNLRYKIKSQKIHSTGEHVLIVTFPDDILVSIYTKDGEFVYWIQVSAPLAMMRHETLGITVTQSGRIAIGYGDYDVSHQGKILVF